MHHVKWPWNMRVHLLDSSYHRQSLWDNTMQHGWQATWIIFGHKWWLFMQFINTLPNSLENALPCKRIAQIYLTRFAPAWAQNIESMCHNQHPRQPEQVFKLSNQDTYCSNCSRAVIYLFLAQIRFLLYIFLGGKVELKYRGLKWKSRVIQGMSWKFC